MLISLLFAITFSISVLQVDLRHETGHYTAAKSPQPTFIMQIVDDKPFMSLVE